MYRFDAEKAQSYNPIQLFYLCVTLLVGTGLVTLYSASYSFAARFFGDGNYFIVRQLVFCAAGIICFFVFSRIRLDILRKCIIPFVCIAAGLCILTLIPGIGVERYGASRWIEIGSFSYQPSEMVKFVLPLYLAHCLIKKQITLTVSSQAYYRQFWLQDFSSLLFTGRTISPRRFFLSLTR